MTEGTRKGQLGFEEAIAYALEKAWDGWWTIMRRIEG
jgi:hypothetical protein